MKKTLLDWYQTNHLTLSQTQRLSEIVETNTLYTLQELKLLAKMPAIKDLDKYHNSAKEQVNQDWLKDNWPWIISLLLLLLTLLIK